MDDLWMGQACTLNWHLGCVTSEIAMRNMEFYIVSGSPSLPFYVTLGRLIRGVQYLVRFSTLLLERQGSQPASSLEIVIHPSIVCRLVRMVHQHIKHRNATRLKGGTLSTRYISSTITESLARLQSSARAFCSQSWSQISFYNPNSRICFSFSHRVSMT
jgi:hypothetical protein